MSTKLTILCGENPDYHLYKETADWNEQDNSARVYLNIRDKDGRDIIDAPIEYVKIEKDKVKIEMDVDLPEEVEKKIKSYLSKIK